MSDLSSGRRVKGTEMPDSHRGTRAPHRPRPLLAWGRCARPRPRPALDPAPSLSIARARPCFGPAPSRTQLRAHRPSHPCARSAPPPSPRRSEPESAGRWRPRSSRSPSRYGPAGGGAAPWRRARGGRRVETDARGGPPGRRWLALTGLCGGRASGRAVLKVTGRPGPRPPAPWRPSAGGVQAGLLHGCA